MNLFKDDREMPTPTVYCDVKNCVYHKVEDICSAGHINAGPTHAISRLDPVCVTFKPEAKS